MNVVSLDKTRIRRKQRASQEISEELSGALKDKGLFLLEYGGMRGLSRVSCFQGHTFEKSTKHLEGGYCYCNQCKELCRVQELFDKIEIEKKCKVVSPLGVYKNNQTRISLVCLVCKAEFVTTTALISMRRKSVICPICISKGRFARRQEAAQRRGFNLKRVFRKNRWMTGELECSNGHIFDRFAGSLYKDFHCPSCLLEKNKEKKAMELLKKVEEAGYKQNTPYENCESAVEFQCSEGHKFMRNPTYFKMSQSCPACRSSSQEEEIDKFLRSLGVINVIRNSQVLPHYQVDLFVPEHGLGIEYHGLYWHSYERLLDRGIVQPKLYHRFKADEADKQGIRLIQIFEDEWFFKRSVVERIIKSVLGKLDNERVYARECEGREVSFNDAKDFFNKNHIGGAGLVGSIRFGLYFNNNLVACISFLNSKKLSKKKFLPGQYELYKYATSCRVSGGIYKLLSVFEKQYIPSQLLTYVDRRYFTGSLFVKAGFKLIDVTQPGYYYFMRDSTTRFHRFKLRKNWVEPITEFQMCSSQGGCKIYDAGHLKLVKDYKGRIKK